MEIKNILLTLFVSRGVPMMLGGDEFRRTQHGNNNAYCQDNEIGWWLWDRQEEHANIHRFTRAVIAFRQKHPTLHRTDFYSDEDVHWFGPTGETPSWDDPEARALGCCIQNTGDGPLTLLFNGHSHAVDFSLLPSPSPTSWHRKIDTSISAPADVLEAGEEAPLDPADHYSLDARSSAVLVA